MGAAPAGGANTGGGGSIGGGGPNVPLVAGGAALALGSAGLAIDRLEEWPSHKTSPEGPRKRALDKSRKEIPMFLALRARNFA